MFECFRYALFVMHLVYIYMYIFMDVKGKEKARLYDVHPAVELGVMEWYQNYLIVRIGSREILGL